MKITKLEHSCIDITDKDGRLVIDPGIFSKSLTDFSNISALVITHVHPDHFDANKVGAIVEANPEISIFTTGEVAKELKGGRVTVPERHKPYSVGPFMLEFFGEQHGVVDPTMIVQNIGVLVNQKLYYPGDSLTTCGVSFEVLAIPTEGPWLKTNELPALIESLDCKQIFATHNGLLNEMGLSVYNNWLDIFAKAKGKTFLDLRSGQSLEV